MYPSDTGKILILTGRQRSGKDSVANYFVDHYGFKRVALADKLKEIAGDLFFMEGKNRNLLITLGQKMREIDPDVWLKYLWKTHIENAPEGSKIVITDVRFPNEFDFLTQIGAKSIKITASTNARMQREGYQECFDSDLTENQLINCITDFHIDNSSTFILLYKQVDEIAQKLGISPRRKPLWKFV